MSHPPLNLAARDFDAYAAEKATSNAFSRPRLELKQRALGWARAVVARLAELGIAVDVHGSDEHPSLRNRKRVDCQWVFFSRDQAARDELERLLDRGRSIAAEIDDPSPFTRHAFLALRLDAGAVEVCFAVHPEARVDVDNLRARLAEGREADAVELIEALRALPEQFTLGVSPADRTPVSAITPAALRALVERAAAGEEPLWIGWSVGRDTAVQHSGILDEQLEDAIIALAPVYRLVAWSRENDRIALDSRIESAVQERARAHAEAEAQTERWRTEQAEARRTAAEQARARAAAHEPLPVGPRAGGARKPSLDTLFAPKPKAAGLGPDGGRPPRPPGAVGPAGGKPAGDRRLERRSSRPPGAPPASPESARPAAPLAPDTTGETPPSRWGLLQTPAEPRAIAPPAVEPAPASPPRAPVQPAAPAVVEKGGKVRVLFGPFADKVGVVGELDGRGGARVLLGLLSTRLEVANLEPVVEGRERPSLQTSHRRPLAPAPRKAR